MTQQWSSPHGFVARDLCAGPGENQCECPARVAGPALINGHFPRRGYGKGPKGPTRMSHLDDGFARCNKLLHFLQDWYRFLFHVAFVFVKRSFGVAFCAETRGYFGRMWRQF